MSSVRKKRYRLKPLPIFLAALVLLALILLVVFLFQNSDEDAPASSTTILVPSSESAVSEPITESGLATGGDPDDATESLPTDSGSSQTEPSAVAKIPDPPVNNEDGTISYNGAVYVISQFPEGSTTDWNLILLNPEEENKIDAELDFVQTEFDGQLCDTRAAEAYQSMKDAALSEANATLFLRSGYRSIITQNVNYEAAVNRYREQGYSEEDALARTNAYYTVPGHSEHHSGLAFDIITPEYHRDIWSLDERFAATDAYTWLKENSWKYGFVLRYPKDKQTITRINFEPWHYRYVGVEHARFMQESNLCLEEYIALLKSAGK